MLGGRSLLSAQQPTPSNRFGLIQHFQHLNFRVRCQDEQSLCGEVVEKVNWLHLKQVTKTSHKKLFWFMRYSFNKILLLVSYFEC